MIERRLACALLLAAVVPIGCDGCGEGGVSSIAIDPVARCAATSGDVRRRLARSAAWGSVGGGAELFAGDWVQTAASANAQVVYNDGSELFVEPSTTVVIEVPNAEGEASDIRRIAVRSGSVRAGLRRGSRQPVQVELPDGDTIAVSRPEGQEDADVRIRVDEAGGTEVAVVRGAALLTTPRGEVVEVPTGTSRRLEDTGDLGPAAPLPAAPTLRLEAPTDPVYVGVPVAWTWTTPEPERTHRLELSRDEGFATFDVVKEPVESPHAFTPEAPGTWSARVFAVDADGRRSPASNRVSVQVVVDDRLRNLTAPEDGTTYRVPRGAARVEFTWKPHPSGGPYRVVVATDPELEDVTESWETSEPRAAQSFAPGTYHWGVVRGDVPLFVEPFTFRVVRNPSDLQVPSRLDWSRRRRP